MFILVPTSLQFSSEPVSVISQQGLDWCRQKLMLGRAKEDKHLNAVISLPHVYKASQHLGRPRSLMSVPFAMDGCSDWPDPAHPCLGFSYQFWPRSWRSIMLSDVDFFPSSCCVGRIQCRNTLIRLTCSGELPSLLFLSQNFL